MMKLPKEINEAANGVAESLDAAVFVYSGAIDDKGFGGLLKTMEVSDEQPFRRNAVMLLTTYGGHAGQAYRIARLFQTMTDKFSLCVPSQCKSAGTLIALGASEIYMPIASELGPLDVQLRRRDEIGQRRSGMVVRTALDGLAEETFKVFEQVMLRITISSGHSISFDVASRVASTIATGVMAPVYAQVDPESLGNDLRDLSVATAYGERLAEYGGNATEETVRQLVEEYPTHEFIIDSTEAEKLFKTIKKPTDEMRELIIALVEIVYSVQTPHVTLRVDGDFEHNGGDRDDGTGNERDAAAGVGRGRKAAGRGDHKGSDRKGKGKGKESS